MLALPVIKEINAAPVGPVGTPLLATFPILNTKEKEKENKIMIHPDDLDFTYASDADWDHAAALELGATDTETAWILTDRDVWYSNPFYKGPAVRHPEDDRDIY